MSRTTWNPLSVDQANQIEFNGPSTIATQAAIEAQIGYAGAAELRLRTIHEDPQIAFIKYAVNPGDGAQGWFQWNTTETGADNGVSIIRAVDNPAPNPGAWTRLS